MAGLPCPLVLYVCSASHAAWRDCTRSLCAGDMPWRRILAVGAAGITLPQSFLPFELLLLIFLVVYRWSSLPCPFRRCRSFRCTLCFPTRRSASSSTLFRCSTLPLLAVWRPPFEPDGKDRSSLAALCLFCLVSHWCLSQWLTFSTEATAVLSGVLLYASANNYPGGVALRSLQERHRGSSKGNFFCLKSACNSTCFRSA
jgi:hypothetical protein